MEITKAKQIGWIWAVFFVFLPLAAFGGEVNLPRTGQTTCYNANGNVIACSGTGQDGDVQAGIEWPAPRFTDNGNGTVTDHLTGLIWLKNANCSGTKTWQQALTYCNTLASGSCGLTDGSVAGDWRLPNRKELLSLIDFSASIPALLLLNPFLNVQSADYWSDSTTADFTDFAWYVDMYDGWVGNDSSKSGNFYVWPVRDGQSGPSGNLTILYPDGGETLNKGQNYSITWTSTDVTGAVAIDLYKGGPAPGFFVMQLAAAAPNTGSYPFNPSASLADGSDYLIRISAHSDTVWDYSNSFFTLSPGSVGDFNNDGKIDLQDAIFTLQSVAGLRNTDSVTLFDTIAMLKILTKEKKNTTSYSGQIITTQDGQELIDDIDFNLTIKEPSLNGTFFRTNDAMVGTLSGSINGNSGTFTGVSEGICPSSFSGSLLLKGDADICVEMDGSDCIGEFISTGELNGTQCINIGGNYYAIETLRTTYTLGGESETEDYEGEAIIALHQNGCSVNYYVPDFDVVREGEIEGNVFQMSGPFVTPLTDEVILTQNEFTAEVTILNQYNFTFQGVGIAEGTADGVPFSCHGNSTGTLQRFFDVAAAVPKGGPIGSFPVDPQNNLNALVSQARQVDTLRVISKGFGAGPNQLYWVEQWLNTVTSNDQFGTDIVLVGHSLGGDAVRRAHFPLYNNNMCNRITIDPINRDLLPLIFNQREYTFAPIIQTGQFSSILATDDSFWGLLGHHITAASELVAPNTNHDTVVHWVRDSGIVRDEVQECLDSYIITRDSNRKMYFQQSPSCGHKYFKCVWGWKDKSTH